MTLTEIAAVIFAAPVDSTVQVLCVDVAHVEDGIYIVDGWHYCSTALTAAGGRPRHRIAPTRTPRSPATSAGLSCVCRFQIIAIIPNLPVKALVTPRPSNHPPDLAETPSCPSCGLQRASSMGCLAHLEGSALRGRSLHIRVGGYEHMGMWAGGVAAAAAAGQGEGEGRGRGRAGLAHPGGVARADLSRDF